jgi:hypothetical protein
VPRILFVARESRTAAFFELRLLLGDDISHLVIQRTEVSDNSTLDFPLLQGKAGRQILTLGAIDMKTHYDRNGRRRWTRARCWAAGVAVIIFLAGPALAVDVARVEEDWELFVNQPDAALNGPQVTCVISPQTMTDAYCAFDINYHTQPDYLAGGLQMHVWNPNTPIITCDFPASGIMQQANETVTWTQTMALANGVLSFSVVNGQSATWGSFGGAGEQLSVNVTAENLNGYNPEVSLENSGVSFASNLVTTLTLKAVRWYAADGTLIMQDTTPQLVHPQD